MGRSGVVPRGGRRIVSGGPLPARGEVWWCELPEIGRRPVVVLSDGIAKDNRIPPKGFLIAEAAARGAEPASGGAAAPGLFTTAEYAGGFHDVTLALPPGGDSITVVPVGKEVTTQRRMPPWHATDCPPDQNCLHPSFIQ